MYWRPSLLALIPILIPILLTLVRLPTLATAQVTLQGRVVDNGSELPVEGAQVTLLNARERIIGRRTTDAAGLFEFVVKRGDAAILRAQHIGFREATSPTLYFDGYQSFSLELRLDPEAILLAPLEVIARAWDQSHILAGFHTRRARGLGWFFTREDIERRRPRYITDLLTTVPGVQLTTSGPANRRTIKMSRSIVLRGECPPQVFVDGFLVNRLVPGGRGGDLSEHMTIDEVVSPSNVEGIEVYHGLSSVPAELLSPNSVCGVVVIWTKRGG